MSDTAEATTVVYDTGPDDDSTAFPWCVIEDDCVSDRFATEAEARAAAAR